MPARTAKDAGVPGVTSCAQEPNAALPDWRDDPLRIDSSAQSLLHMPKRGVYAITPENLIGPNLHRAVALALAGGIALLQFRVNASATNSSQRLADAQVLKSLCAKAGVPLIINNDLDLAAELHLGLHVGENDCGVREARKRLGPEAIIGASCYDSVVLGQRAADSGATYLAFGSFFASPSKDQPRRAELKHLQKARHFELPLVAIGGINLDNAPPIVAAGADFIAVISAIFSAPDVKKASQALAELVQRNSS